MSADESNKHYTWAHIKPIYEVGTQINVFHVYKFKYSPCVCNVYFVWRKEKKGMFKCFSKAKLSITFTDINMNTDKY